MRSEKKSIEQQIEANLQIAIGCMDAVLAKRIRDAEREIREAKALQNQMFNSHFERDMYKKDISPYIDL